MSKKLKLSSALKPSRVLIVLFALLTIAGGYFWYTGSFAGGESTFRAQVYYVDGSGEHPVNGAYVTIVELNHQTSCVTNTTNNSNTGYSGADGWVNMRCMIHAAGNTNTWEFRGAGTSNQGLISPAVGTRFTMTVGGTSTPFRIRLAAPPPPPPPPDSDGDGIPDSSDPCPGSPANNPPTCGTVTTPPPPPAIPAPTLTSGRCEGSVYKINIAWSTASRSNSYWHADVRLQNNYTSNGWFRRVDSPTTSTTAPDGFNQFSEASPPTLTLVAGRQHFISVYYPATGERSPIVPLTPPSCTPGTGSNPGPQPQPTPPGSSPSPGSKPRTPIATPQQQAAAISVPSVAVEDLNKEADQALDQLTSANVKKDETSTITSDDGMVTVTFEAGTFDVDAECVVVSSDPIEGLAYGPYKIACQDKDGNELSTFLKPVSVKFTLPEGEVANDHDMITIDGETKNVLQTEKNNEERTIIGSLDSPLLFGVIKKEGSNVLAWVIGVAILVILIIGGVIWYMRRNSSDSSYDDYIRNQYISSGAGATSPEPAANIDPGQRAGMSVHQPGTQATAIGETHSTPDHTALQEAQDRLAQLQDPTPPAPGSVTDPGPGKNPTNK